MCYNERQMSKNTNLKKAIFEMYPPELWQFLEMASSQAALMGMHLYLVGGAVRDLLLRRTNTDLDLVVDGNAITLATELAARIKSKLITHTRFNTASFSWEHWNIDIATARVESYKKPGALPTLENTTTIYDDLARRDFSINAIALDLQPQHFGELIDRYQAQQDLNQKVIRVLHDTSFQDDATRLWRAVRYEQRLDFQIEKHTLDLLQRDIDYLNTISGDRIRHELELCLKEDQPEKALARAKELGILAKLSPAIKFNQQSCLAMAEARRQYKAEPPPEEIYLGILLYSVDIPELARLNAFLKFPRKIIKSLKDTLDLKDRVDFMKSPGVSNYEIFNSLRELAVPAIKVSMLMQNSALVKSRLIQYLTEWKMVKPSLKGLDLIKGGIPQGGQVQGILEMLLAARLNGEIETLLEEKQLAQKISKADFNIDLAFE
jgi:tRNA nucleotidyltransferase (CCA-adding enzyme)